MTTLADRGPAACAGFTLDAWVFAVRTWVSLVLALYLAFWLQLESPATAALTVAVLAFPTRGQAMEKAFYRIIATVVGLTAAIILTDLFAQAGALRLLALALWIGACVYVSSLLDGFRAYAAVLGIISVSLVAIEPLDTPQNVFELAHERGAAIVIGILAVTLINDVLFAPDYHPRIQRRLLELQGRLSALAGQARQGQSVSSSEAVTLLRDITALRPEITSLSMESSSGKSRSAAARTTMVGLILALAAVRMLALLSSRSTPHALTPAAPCAAAPNTQSFVADGALAWTKDELQHREELVRSSLAAMQAGERPDVSWRAPFYRSHRIAAGNALRAVTYFGFSGLVLSIAGWGSTSVSLAFVGILIGLSFMSPDPTGASKLALIAAPIGCVLAGLLEFVILDGVDDFPLLAIGLIPFAMLPTLLMTIPNVAILSLGRSNLVFTIAIFNPSSQQSYDPQAFLFSCLFLCLAALLLAVCQRVWPPLSPAGHRRVLLAETAQHLTQIRLHPPHRLSRKEAVFRDAVRVAQIAASADEDAGGRGDVARALRMFDEMALRRLTASAPDADGNAMAAAAEMVDRQHGSPDGAAAGALAAAGLALAEMTHATAETER